MNMPGKGTKNVTAGVSVAVLTKYRRQITSFRGEIIRQLDLMLKTYSGVVVHAISEICTIGQENRIIGDIASEIKNMTNSKKRAAKSKNGRVTKRRR